jgi:hypothetical protein
MMDDKQIAEKDALISGLVETRSEILDAVSALSPAGADEVFLGTWSVKELLAHLVGWDYTNKRALDTGRITVVKN